MALVFSGANVTPQAQNIYICLIYIIHYPSLISLAQCTCIISWNVRCFYFFFIQEGKLNDCPCNFRRKYLPPKQRNISILTLIYFVHHPSLISVPQYASILSRGFKPFTFFFCQQVKLFYCPCNFRRQYLPPKQHNISILMLIYFVHHPSLISIAQYASILSRDFKPFTFFFGRQMKLNYCPCNFRRKYLPPKQRNISI